MKNCQSVIYNYNTSIIIKYIIYYMFYLVVTTKKEIKCVDGLIDGYDLWMRN